MYFVPHLELLENIEWSSLSTRHEHIFPADIQEEPGLVSYVESLASLLEVHFRYSLGFRDEEKNYITEFPSRYVQVIKNLVHVALEGLRNAKYHGSKKGHVLFSCSLCRG